MDGPEGTCAVRLGMSTQTGCRNHKGIRCNFNQTYVYGKECGISSVIVFFVDRYFYF